MIEEERSYENETSRRRRNIPISRKLWGIASKYCVVTMFLIFDTVFRVNVIGAVCAHTFRTNFTCLIVVGYQKLDSLRPRSREIERGGWEGQNVKPLKEVQRLEEK